MNGALVTIHLPDGSTRQFENSVTGLQLAESIGAGLAKAAFAIVVDGAEWDLSRPLPNNAKIRILTGKDAEGLEILRHDAAHIMAEAVRELFPDAEPTIGPVIENGFFYDFARDKPFTPDDLIAIEKRMGEIVDRNETITREVWERADAIKFFEARGDKYKVEIIRDLPGTETITLYRQGDFIDLCRGPHLPSTAKLGKAFKLMKVAGAYWRGDAKNAMLQRIYGTAWVNEKDLKQHLFALEEADKRDHRKLGRELDLFHIEEHSPGMVFWHPKGWTLFRTIENYVRSKIQRDGYVEVKTPTLVDRSLWEKSGHWEKFRENMFVSESDEDRTLCVKPMNCPCHVQIFNQGIKSYRDLPLRMAEFGSCHRNEPSGGLHGIMRVRGFTQDDAHIFCTKEQITEETITFCNLLKEVYADFGFSEILVKFSTRPEVRAGTDQTWDEAEGYLEAAVKAAGLEYTINPGEGAFYGPKLEFVLRDALGRDWQCGTLQVDFVLPERLDANYIAADGAKHRPVMLHRAILGSLERFIGIIIEEYAGKFPLWLSPIQAVVTTITNEADEYAKEVQKALLDAGIRAEIDLSNNKINYKVREHSKAKVPLILAVGAKEQAEKTLSVRRLGSEGQKVLPLMQMIAETVHEIQTRSTPAHTPAKEDTL
jgi:threonyl-tRNA synthetase